MNEYNVVNCFSFIVIMVFMIYVPFVFASTSTCLTFTTTTTTTTTTRRPTVEEKHDTKTDSLNNVSDFEEYDYESYPAQVYPVEHRPYEKTDSATYQVYPAKEVSSSTTTERLEMKKEEKPTRLAENFNEYEYYDLERGILFRFFDTWGLEADRSEEWHQAILSIVHQREGALDIAEWFHTIYYLLSVQSGRVEAYELEAILKPLYERGSNVTLILTNFNEDDPLLRHRMAASGMAPRS